MPHLSARDIATSVCRHWSDAMTSDIVTIYPGIDAGTETLTEWYELWVDAWSTRTQRTGAPESWDVSVSVHGFTKPGLDAGRVQDLAETARRILAAALIPVRATSADPLLGYLQLQEPEILDLSRGHRERRHSSLRHALVRCRGVAQTVVEG
ncbi:MAG TPA: hypothetical protein VL132_05120 [Planctomycetaceae bacterium]|nr:hypothetical protein [Planctomycetaceae bacterium]